MSQSSHIPAAIVNPNSRIAELIGRHLNGIISESEGAELNEWIAASEENHQFFERYNNEQYVSTELEKHYHYDVQAGWETLVLRANIPFHHQVPMIKLRWLLRAAAVLLLLAGFAWIFVISERTTGKKVTSTPVAYNNDIPPGKDKAVLQLADGTKIVLDSAGNGILAEQGGTEVIKLKGGKIKYKEPLVSTKYDNTTYNTLSAPRGGQYQVMLPDNSKVWLNAASSITYPTAFTGKERRVEITGEAYFEVEKAGPISKKFYNREGRDAPFIVQINEKTEVEVSGTNFNINAYHDEGIIKTTLLEGSMKVATAILYSGQQALVDNKGEVKIAENINIEEATAWKNGFIYFQHATIETILRQLSRWYDIKVIYEYKPGKEFRVKIPRSEPISKILHYLEATGYVHFEIEGRTVTVKR